MGGEKHAASRFRRSFLFALGLCGPLALAAACAPSAPESRHPNVLLVVVDTLRRDALGCYGEDEYPASPRIDALAASGVVHEGFHAVSPWTLPSMATLFSGLPPADHDLMRMVGNHSRFRCTRSLADRFREAGYATGCVTGNFLLGRRFASGLDQGFDFYDDAPANHPDPHRGSTAEEVASRGLSWLKSLPPERPWFLVLHFFDPHISYEHHPEFAFTDPNYRGWVVGGLGSEDYRAHQAEAGAADRRQLRALYEEEVRAVDRACGRVFAALRARGEERHSLLVLTADHGEELAERGRIGHTTTLHRELVDVPLVVAGPGLPAGRRVGAARSDSQLDLPATLLDLAGLSAGGIPGRSFAALLRGKGTVTPPRDWIPFEVDFQPVLEEHAEKRVRLRGGISGPWKLIQDPRDGREWLYQWERDPEEQRDLSQDRDSAAAAKRLRALLRAHRWWSPQ